MLKCTQIFESSLDFFLFLKGIAKFDPAINSRWQVSSQIPTTLSIRSLRRFYLLRESPRCQPCSCSMPVRFYRRNLWTNIRAITQGQLDPTERMKHF